MGQPQSHGRIQAEPAPAPAPTPLPQPKLNEAWRKMNWEQRDSMLSELTTYEPGNSQMRKIRILLHGPVGAGKSSFVNTVKSVFKGRISSVAAVDGQCSSGLSYTIKYETHKIEKPGNHREFLPFVFNDVMGLEVSASSGVHEDDIIMALRGHVKDGHKFNPKAPLSVGDPGYNDNPTPEEKVHCLVCVIAANAVNVMSEGAINKMRRIRLAARDLGIPELAIMTKVDEACPLVKANLQDIYMSKSIKEKMESFSKCLGIPMNCILPVQNYHQEIDLDEDVDVLLLRALKQVVDIADDYIKKQEDNYSIQKQEYNSVSV